MRGANGKRGGWSGQSVVEFAFSSLLFLSLVFGMIDLGRVVFMRTMLTNAVREAARAAAVKPSMTTSELATTAAARSPGLALSDSNFTIACSDWSTPANTRSCTSGSTNPKSVIQNEQVKVCATYTFTMVATRIVGRSSITTTECESTSVR